MKHLSGIIVFVVVFVAVGVAMHVALYQQPGIFVWTLVQDEDSGRPSLVRTTLEPLPVMGELAAPDAGVAEVIVAEKSAPAAEEAKEEVVEPQPVEEIEEEAPDPSVVSLFDGKTLGDWESTKFGGEGEVWVNEDGNLEFDFGAVMTGVTWGAEVPATSNYELTLDAMKLDGYDFFAAITFPVKESHATFVIGGWGGGVVGISCVDDLNASENETMNIEGFNNNVWHRVKIRVTDDRLEAWIGDDQMVDLALRGKKISLLPGDIELSAPMGIASFQTRAQYRNIEWRHLPAPEE